VDFVMEIMENSAVSSLGSCFDCCVCIIMENMNIKREFRDWKGCLSPNISI